MEIMKVCSIFAGVLRIRSEPDEEARICGSVSFGEELTVERTKKKSESGTEYFKIVGGGYVIAKYMVEQKTQQEINEEITESIQNANDAAAAATAAAKACEGIAAGINTMVDSATGKVCELGMTDGIITVKEA